MHIGTRLSNIGNLNLKLVFSGPASLAVDTPVQGTSSAIKQASVPFVFMFVQTSPSGHYTLQVTAIDGDGNQSNELSTQFDLY